MENNIKIRAIEIEAFRGYNNRVYFDFTIPGGKLADLVVLYAPNGFGKTSFFDGIEWAIKGHIERFRDDPFMMQTANREKGNILKNSDSTLDTGRVKIIDQDHNNFERFTTIRSDQWDLLKGGSTNTSNSKIKLNLEKYEEAKRVEILPQSRVDAFIASKKPVDRYEALVNFWGGQDDSNYYKAVSDLSKQNEKTILHINNQINSLNDEIIKLSLPDEKIYFIEDLMDKIKDKNIFNSDSLFFNNIDSTHDFNNLSLLINNKIAELENNKSKFNEILEKTNNLSLSYSLFINHKVDGDKLKNEIEQNKSILNTAQDLILLNEKNRSNNSQLTNIQTEYKDFLYLAERKELFINYTKNITEGNNEIGLLNLENQDLINRLNGFEYDKILSAKQVEKLLLQRSEIHIKREDISDISNQLVVNSYRTNELNKRLALSKKICLIRENKFKLINAEIENANTILSLDGPNLLSSSLINFDNTTIHNLRDILKEISNLENELAKKNEHFLKVQSLNNNLQTLITIGHQHVTETKTNVCPLCNAIYENYEVLLNNINLQKDDALGLATIILEIGTVTTKINDLRDLFSKEIIVFKSEIQKKANELQILSISLENKFNNSSDLVAFYSLEKQIIDGNFRQLRSRLNNYQIIELNIKSVLENLRIELSTLDSAINASKNTLTHIVNNISETNQKISLNRTKISELTSEINLYINNTFYSEINELLIKREINNLFYFSEDFDQRAEVLSNDIISKIDEISKISLSIEEINSKLSSVDFSLIQQELQDAEYRLNLLNGNLLSFTSSYTKIIGSSEYNSIAIEKKLSELTNTLTNLDNSIFLLRQFKENTDFLKNRIDISAKRLLINELKDLLDKHTSISKTINKTHSELSVFLKNKINSVFNHDIINDIYQKIDPHPSFKSIILEPIFNEKPELLIKVFDQKNNLLVDPVLYLSSAQVSILSLSIFLAKALQNSSPLVNTIFMDDPIQYMDSINILSFIDLIRSILSDKLLDRQIVLSTHDENFFRLLKRKFNSTYYKAKFIEFQSYGILKENHSQ